MEGMINLSLFKHVVFMETLSQRQDLSELSNEVRGAKLGDRRRTARYCRILDLLAAHPNASIPVAMHTSANQEAYYRLMNNDALDHHDLLEPHVDQTVQRARRCNAVLVVHDTTEFRFNLDDAPPRTHLATFRKNSQGFLWHASLAFSSDPKHQPLGLLCSRPFVHDNPKQICNSTRSFWQERSGLFENEQERWFEAVRKAEEKLGPETYAIHIQDRDGDDYRSFVAMTDASYRFVIRMNKHRNVVTGSRKVDQATLLGQLDEIEWETIQRSVVLSKRSAQSNSRHHKPRKRRETLLKVRASRFPLKRPQNVSAKEASRSLDINVVEVMEVDVPDGEDAVHWLLATTEPIENAEGIWKIVDWYRARWNIEEFFKALKTGTNYTKLQHSSASSLLKALSAKSIVAWSLLRLRHLTHHAPEVSALKAVNPVQLQILKSLKPKAFSKKESARECLGAIALLGGFTKKAGRIPGWLVLGRGWNRLLEAEMGFRIAMNAL